ncbi:SLBB domain-containing protein [Sediminibacterium goheungense]|uniref:Protein involved in polysaccharide export with SLBB domain n=1 Tax=Sediminibacterium goheungense TaxID=1086393 RepID=A0A4R6IYE3_9BACT|nr:SLBB domain-containing protein [Sediminibacterium goheungense]TDO26895.1 protein involved in polysaccharide export with SLBB domain [Sediminibacterium goheungense]
MRLKLLLLLGCWFFHSLLFSQDILQANDLSKINIDQVSDADISKLIQQLKQSSVSITEVEQMAAAKGMPQSEISKLKQRIAVLEGKGTSKKTAIDVQYNQRETIPGNYPVIEKKDHQEIKIFGAQLFTTASLAFEPNLRIATPSDYQLGPDDELEINIFGVQEAHYKVQVQPEGTINIPNVGIVTLAGLTVEEAKKLIRDKLVKTVYKSIGNGQTHFTLTLGNIRSIRITILGAAKPGNYTVSSFTTLFNALYLCGGPEKIGSFRSIELIRNNKVHLRADLYQFLLKGNTSQNILLKEGDIINIPVYQKRVTITGEVKRPGLYELLDNETAQTLIDYAGGFTEKSYTANIKVNQFSNRERRVKDLSQTDFALYLPGKGDSIAIEPVLDKYENRVTITGAIYRPGIYELKEGMKLGELLKKAEGFREDAYLNRALLKRQKSDHSKEMIAFSLKDWMDDPAKDLLLQKNDSIVISSIKDMADEKLITVSGEVRKPGVFLYRNQYTLKDLLLESGGFTEAASAYRIEIARRIKAADTNTVSNKLAEIMQIDVDRDLDTKGNQLLLEPYDLITVRKNPGYAEQKQVKVEGEVLYPGHYTIQTKKDRISDLISRAGGFTDIAYQDAISLTRINKQAKAQEDEKAKVVAGEMADSINNQQVAELLDPKVKIAINISTILDNPASDENLYLEEGDVLEVPKKDLLVKISGEVYAPTKITYEAGRSLKYYLSRAGGLTDKARHNSIYVVYANGQIAKTEKYFFGLIKHYPRIQTGADIIVPARKAKSKLTTGEILGMAGIIVSMAGVAVSIMNTLK